MAGALATPQVQPVAMQGIAIPAAIVDKQAFFARTRRHTQQEKSLSFTLGTSTRDIIPLRKSDILSEVTLHITGSLVITPGTGSVASTAAWPYNLIRNVKFSANGASSLISARGWTLKAREIAKDEGLTGTVSVQSTKFEIPTANGAIIVPDLSMFHSLVETNTVALSNGENEAVVVGQGAGKYVLRVIYQHMNGTVPAPIPMTAANF